MTQVDMYLAHNIVEQPHKDTHFISLSYYFFNNNYW